MTEVTLWMTEDKISGFRISGHADSDIGGEWDLVCCAVSVLAQTCVESIHRVAGVAEEDVPVIVRDGFLSLESRSRFAKDQCIQTIFSVFQCGLALLTESYGEYIKVIQEVPKC